MKITELLESITSTVYHTTSIYNAISIINQNKFVLQPIRKNGRLKFTMSFSRMYYNDYMKDRRSYAVFEVDGKKLSQNYKGEQYRFNKDISLMYYNEAEDRILSDKKEVLNADKYIKALRILFPFKGIPEGLEECLEKIDYPVFLFRKKEDFMNRTNGEKLR